MKRKKITEFSSRTLPNGKLTLEIPEDLIACLNETTQKQQRMRLKRGESDEDFIFRMLAAGQKCAKKWRVG